MTSTPIRLAVSVVAAFALAAGSLTVVVPTAAADGCAASYSGPWSGTVTCTSSGGSSGGGGSDTSGGGGGAKSGGANSGGSGATSLSRLTGQQNPVGNGAATRKRAKPGPLSNVLPLQDGTGRSLGLVCDPACRNVPPPTPGRAGGPPAPRVGKPAPPPPPKLSPQQAATLAVAKLRFVAVGPGIGPDHGDNGLQDDKSGLSFDAPVGYPVWLWAQGGDIDTRTVSDTEGGTTVAITIELDGISWSMGDGTTQTCGPGTPWVRGAVPSGTPSPTCGHVYERRGGYRVTATTRWTITWQAGDQTGTVAKEISRSRHYQVGELQVIIQ